MLRIFAVLEAARKRFSGNVIKDVEVVSYVKVEESGVFVGLSTLEDYVLPGFLVCNKRLFGYGLGLVQCGG